MEPFIKWPGGKQEELRVIIPNLPKEFNRYIEPFVGGGAVYLNIEAKKEYIINDKSEEYIINDKSEELMKLYECIKSQDKEFFDKLTAINNNWILLENIVEKNSSKLTDEYIKFREDKSSELDFHNYLFCLLSLSLIHI